MNNEIEEKKSCTNKILMAIIIILLLSLGGLSYYTFFVRDKKVDKPNPVVELSNEELSNLIHGFENLINKYYNDENYNKYFTGTNDLPDWMKLEVMLDKNNYNVTQVNSEISYFNDLIKYQEYYKKYEKDSNGNSYKEYDDDENKLVCNEFNLTHTFKKGEIRAILRSLNFTVDEIDKSALNAWRCMANDGGWGGRSYKVYPKDIVTKKMKEIFGNNNSIFNNSFSFPNYYYDNNLEKLYCELPNGRTAGLHYNDFKILDNKKVGDIQEIIFIPYNVSCMTNNENIECSILDDSFKLKSIDIDNAYSEMHDRKSEIERLAKDYVINNSTKLSKFKLTFKNDIYESLKVYN